MIKEVKSVYAELRSTIDSHFHKIYEHAVRMAALVNVITSMPRNSVPESMYHLIV